MRQASGRLLEIWMEGEVIVGKIACLDELAPAPGQYLLAAPLDDPLAPRDQITCGCPPSREVGCLDRG